MKTVEVVCAGPGVYRWMGLDMVGGIGTVWHLIRAMEYRLGGRLAAIEFCCACRLVPGPRAVPFEHKECLVDPGNRQLCTVCVEFRQSLMFNDHLTGL